jgi:hypothetical protein
MTQSLVQPSQVAPPMTPDALKKMLVDLEVDRKRLKTTPPADLPSVVRELAETVLEYNKDLILELIQQRDWATEVVESLDGRMSDLEDGNGGGTQLLPEDAEKFKALAMGVDHMITEVAASVPSISANVSLMTAFENLRTLAKDCLQIIEDTTLVDGDDDEDDEEEDRNGTGSGG